MSRGSPSTSPRPRPWRHLVDADSLAKALGDPDLVVLDVRHNLGDPEWGPRVWSEGHLPGALHAHVDRDLSGRVTPRTGRHPLPDLYDFIDTCSRWGIDARVQVVAYDDRGGAFASRLWWLLRDYGHIDVAVLDGGIQAWTAAGHALSTDVPHRKPRRFQGKPGHMETVSAWDITTRTPRRLIDARAPERYRGDEEPIDPVAGHIVGAQNVPTNMNLGPDGRFLPPEELRARYGGVLGDRPARDAAVYCGSGITAPHDILAMEIAGFFGAALYPGSWSEWIRNPMRPVGKGERAPGTDKE